jgi:hypothetical protein
MTYQLSCPKKTSLNPPSLAATTKMYAGYNHKSYIVSFYKFKLTQTTPNYLQNRNLFSNHYLESLIKDDQVWNETDAFNRTKEIYNTRKGSWKNKDESRLEDFLIKPMLKEVLGHYFIPQALHVLGMEVLSGG